MFLHWVLLRLQSQERDSFFYPRICFFLTSGDDLGERVESDEVEKVLCTCSEVEDAVFPDDAQRKGRP